MRIYACAKNVPYRTVLHVYNISEKELVVNIKKIEESALWLSGIHGSRM